jgi:hypothetical protein
MWRILCVAGHAKEMVSVLASATCAASSCTDSGRGRGSRSRLVCLGQAGAEIDSRSRKVNNLYIQVCGAVGDEACVEEHSERLKLPADFETKEYRDQFEVKPR